MEDKVDRSSVKMLLEENYIIVCDINVYLRIYDYSPEFAEFAIACLSAIKDFLYMTYTSFLEYKKHYIGKYVSAKTKIENYNKKLDELTEKFQSDLAKEFDRIGQYHFPDMEDLKIVAIDKVGELKKMFDDYYDNHELLVAINEQYLQQDPIKAFVDSISERVLLPYSLEKIYELCDEGKKRFKKGIPPGFKDKEKEGIRQYSDFILWSEIIEYSSRFHKNIVFVTDDVKADWWKKITNEAGSTSQAFHSKLVEEFERKTGQEIIALTSTELFKKVSQDFGVEVTDTISMALKQTIDQYVFDIQHKAFEKVMDEIAYYPSEYIDEMSADIGTEGLEDCEIESYDLVGYSLVERNKTEMIYLLSYQVSLSAVSYDYWGRDDDTKEIIKSPPNRHTFEGTIQLQVVRVVDDFVDLLYDNSFNDVSIISGELKQTQYISGMEEEYEPYDDGQNYCPKCGKAMTFETDALNGFCIECTNKHEDI